MTQGATWQTPAYQPRVTRLRRGLWILPVLGLVGVLGASLLYLQSRPEEPVLALKETGTWPAWLNQKGPGPAAHDPEPPNPLLDQLKKMQADLDAQRRANEQQQAALEALAKRPPPAAPAAAPKPPAEKPVKRQHASMLYVSHDVPTRPEVLPNTYTLAEGATKIQCQMETEMNSEIPGVFTAKVTSHVYDTETGKQLLIPQGSTILGQYDSGQLLYGNERIPTWTLSAALPDGRSVDLGKAPVTDNVGIMGLTGDVDHHFWRNLAAILIAGTLRGGAQALQAQLATAGNGASTVLVGTGQTTSTYGQQLVLRTIDTRPTIRVHAGSPCTVILTKPLNLPAYY